MAKGRFHEGPHLRGWVRSVGMGPGCYTTLGNEVILEPDGRLYNPKGGHLVGSSATLRECTDYLAKLGIVGEDEIIAMTFYNPLRLVGIDSSEIMKD